MSRAARITSFAMFAVAAIAAMSVAPAFAGSMNVDHAWAPPQSDTNKPATVFAEIKNAGADDTLVSVQTPVANVAQLHNSKESHGKMRMRREMTLHIGKDGISLNHDGTHIMLMGLKAPLTPGQTFPMTLNFEKAGQMVVQVEVKKHHAM